MIWILEKGLVCKECKFTCHKRCYKKTKIKCGIKDVRKKSIANASVFGNNLCELVSDDIQIPTVVARLINEIENKGLFSEGIYRKSPSAVQVKQLKNSFSNAKDVNKVDLGVYAIHVTAGVLKLFFRTLPSPLITAESYDEFLRACDLSDSEARLQRFHTLIDTLPKANQDTLERVIFHLARVAKYEESNLMSPSGLSVIWAPCLMRPREGGSALDGLYDIRKQSMIVESLIVGQMAKIDATLVDISKIDQNNKNITAKLLRLNRRKGAEDELSESEEQQRKLLGDQLEKLDKQKAMLTANLSSLTPHSSLVFDEDNSTDSDNCTGDELDGEKKDRQEKSITEEQDKDVSEDKQEHRASTSHSGPPSEQPSTGKTNSNERRQSKTQVKTNLPKHYMDSSDSQESLDSVT